MLKRIITTLALPLLLLGVALPGWAVTQKEMEQARTITAFWYLRYANNGSGYLEEGKTPASMAELEKMLKETERTNLKAFKAVQAPSDYASWDKEKLVAYWGGTFFNSPGLKAEGKVARNRVKGKLKAMTVAAPSPASAAPAAETTPAASASSAQPQPQAQVEPQGALPSAEAIAEQAQAAESAAVATIDAETSETKSERRNSGGSTWIYIVALIILVGVVVWLVIFASKTMQEGNKAEGRRQDEDADVDAPRLPAAREYAPAAVAQPEPQSVVRQAVAEESADVKGMRREIKGLREECMRLGEENGRLKSDLAEARREVEALRGRLRAADAVASAASVAGNAREEAEEAETPVQPAVQPAEQRQPAAPAPRKVEPIREEAEEMREIYLGRVNPQGLFVRADRRPVADKTVFVLSTTDGYTGSYRVLQIAEVIERCLDNPDHYLAGGCTAPDILATDDATQIRTLQSGTAIFENGCWRMIRKTKIVYE